MPLSAVPSGLIARANKPLSDPEGILAFALCRKQCDDIQIANGLGTSLRRVQEFFAHYRAHWPQPLVVPLSWSPEVLADAVEAAFKRTRGAA